MATVSDFVVVYGGEFWLPGLISSGGTSHIRGFQDLPFDLPTGVTGSGIVSWVAHTAIGDDDGIDLAYEFEGYSWVSKKSEYFGIQLPVGGLKPGHNNFRFTMTRGGKVTVPDPDEYLGGKGKLRIGQVCLLYQRNQ